MEVAERIDDRRRALQQQPEEVRRPAAAVGHQEWPPHRVDRLCLGSAPVDAVLERRPPHHLHQQLGRGVTPLSADARRGRRRRIGRRRLSRRRLGRRRLRPPDAQVAKDVEHAARLRRLHRLHEHGARPGGARPQAAGTPQQRGALGLADCAVGCGDSGEQQADRLSVPHAEQLERRRRVRVRLRASAKARRRVQAEPAELVGVLGAPARQQIGDPTEAERKLVDANRARGSQFAARLHKLEAAADLGGRRERRQAEPLGEAPDLSDDHGPAREAHERVQLVGGSVCLPDDSITLPRARAPPRPSAGAREIAGGRACGRSRLHRES
eukprot:1014656-Prymnesium_polylepis.2